MAGLGSQIATRLVWIRRALWVGFSALAVWLSVKLGLALMTPSSLWEPILVAETAQARVASSQTYDFSYNPFAAGATSIDVEPVMETGDDAPETTLNLELKGLRSGENGTAFILTPNGQEDNFYIGEEIMPGVYLRGVFPTYALIDVNGQTQRLTTEDAKAERNRSARSTNGAPARTAGLQTIRQPDAATFLSQIQITPSFDTDMNRNGVVVTPRTSAIDLSTYGLRDGDIITRFAGQNLIGGLPDIVALRRSAESGRPVSVDILRDGQPMTITIGSSS